MLNAASLRRADPAWSAPAHHDLLATGSGGRGRLALHLDRMDHAIQLAGNGGNDWIRRGKAEPTPAPMRRAHAECRCDEVTANGTERGKIAGRAGQAQNTSLHSALPRIIRCQSPLLASVSGCGASLGRPLLFCRTATRTIVHVDGFNLYCGCLYDTLSKGVLIDRL